jgi:hypothetical protein
MWTPSTSRPTRSSASSAVDRQTASCAAVFATKRRLTALAGNRLAADGRVLIDSRVFRGQLQNREAARDRHEVEGDGRERGHRRRRPVHEDPELRVLVPVRQRVPPDRFQRWLVVLRLRWHGRATSHHARRKFKGERRVRSGSPAGRSPQSKISEGSRRS